MAFTYDASLLSSSELFQVRLNIGDTDSTDPKMQDEEINYALSITSSVLAASIKCCNLIVASYANNTDYSLGPHAEKASQRVKHYKELATQLRTDNITANGIPTFTGPEEDFSIFDHDLMNYASCGHTDEEDD
jgi:hypothetical protein